MGVRERGETQKSRRAARRVASSIWEEVKWPERGTLEDEKREREREREARERECVCVRERSLLTIK